MPMTIWELRQLQSLPLEAKVNRSFRVIRDWYDHWNGNVYVAFSGGKDSVVVLHLVRTLFPGVPAVFCNTRMEYPENMDIVNSVENMTFLFPKLSFGAIIKRYGYPVVSKEQAERIYHYRHTKSEKFKHRLWYGDANGKGAISKRWRLLLHAPFEISAKCCDIMKKNPADTYTRRTGRHPFLGTRADESYLRTTVYLRTGCSITTGARPRCNPIAFWTEQDTLRYIKENDLPLSKVYGDIVETPAGLQTTGLKRTGCMYCMFGLHEEKEPNRFQQMRHTHPEHYDYCINKLGLGEILDYMMIPYR